MIIRETKRAHNPFIKQPAPKVDTIVGIDKVRTLLDLPPKKGYCLKPQRSAHLRGIKNPNRTRLVKFACKSWTCPVCSAWLRLRDGVHYSMKLLAANGVPFQAVYNAETWPTVKRQLHRVGASWVRVGTKYQPGVVLGVYNSPVGEVFADRSAAVVRLGRALRELVPFREPDGRCRPVGSSTDWKPLEKEPQYEHVGWFRTDSPDAVQRLLDSLQIGYRRHDGTGAKVFDIPPEKRCELELSLPSLNARRSG